MIVLISSLMIVFLSNAQVFTVERGKVVYGSSGMDADSLIKKRYAILCDSYIKEFYSEKKLHFLYLIINKDQHSSINELSYDDLSGYSSEYEYYGVNKKYNNPGLRIGIHSAQDEPENILKLLDYGLNNLRELKKRRKRLLKSAKRSQLENLSLSQGEINRIIATPLSDRIQRFLSSFSI